MSKERGSFFGGRISNMKENLGGCLCTPDLSPLINLSHTLDYRPYETLPSNLVCDGHKPVQNARSSPISLHSLPDLALISYAVSVTLFSGSTTPLGENFKSLLSSPEVTFQLLHIPMSPE